MKQGREAWSHCGPFQSHVTFYLTCYNFACVGGGGCSKWGKNPIVDSTRFRTKFELAPET